MMSDPQPPEAARPAARRLVWQIGAATLGRFFVSISRRFIYPFAPALSRGLGVPLMAITSLIAINQATGLLSPLFGPLSDRWGYRMMMLVGLGLLGVGLIAGGVLPFYGVILVALLLAGVSKAIYDPALQSYVGERVPFHRRGLVIGLTEFSWAGSVLVGVPLIGLLIDRYGWQSPFLVLGGLSLLSMVTLALMLPAENRPRSGNGHANGFRQAWGLLSRNRAALGALGFYFLNAISNDNLFVVYGAWLENAFGLSIVALGLSSTAIGAAELLGEGLTASIADRLGLKRALTIGLALSAFSYALLPFMGKTLPMALTGLFIVFLTFEFTIVTALSLSTEILPGARATMMSSLIATASVGRVIGAFMGGLVWSTGGIMATGLVSAAITGLALVCLGWGLRNWPNQAGS